MFFLIFLRELVLMVFDIKNNNNNFLNIEFNFCKNITHLRVNNHMICSLLFKSHKRPRQIDLGDLT